MLHTGGVKNQITVRGIDRETEKRLRDLARRRRISLNRAAGILLRKGAGLREEDAGPEVVGESLYAFVGSWSREQERALLDSIREMEQVDRDLWT